MPSARVSHEVFRKLSSYIVNTGAGTFNLPREDVDALYGPGWPIAPVTMPMDSDLPREFDYPVGINYTLQPRVGYETLMSVAALQAAFLNVPEVSAPVNLIIRLLCGFTPYFRDKSTKQRVKDGYEFNHLLVEPERDIPFNVWLTKYKKSSKVFAAPAYFKKRDNNGVVQEMEFLDGSTLFLIINSRGKLPQPNEIDPELQKFIESVKRGDRRYLPAPRGSYAPFDPAISLNKSERFVPFSMESYLAKAKKFVDNGKRVPTTPAFTQIIKGVPFSFWDKDQVYFMPEPPSPAVNTPYGETFIERSWPWINWIALVTAFELGHYRTGNMPEGVFTIPKDIAPSLPKLAQMEREWNARMAEGSQVQHARNRFMFDGSKWFPTKKPDFQKDLYAQANHEILFAIGVPPEEMGERPGKGMGGKGFEIGTANTLGRQLLESEKKGVEIAFTKALVDSGEEKTECYLDYPTEQIDPTQQAADLQNDFIHGLKSMNDILTSQDKEAHGNTKDENNPWNWHFMIVGNSYYVLEKLNVDPTGLATPTNAKPAAQAGAAPFDPERALADGQERPAKTQAEVANKLMRQIETGESLEGVTFFMPVVKVDSKSKPDSMECPADCDPKEFEVGMQEEQEHADTVNGDQSIIRRIVIDHLKEDPKYYTHLHEVMKGWITIDGKHILIGDENDAGHVKTKELEKGLVGLKGNEKAYIIDQNGKVLSTKEGGGGAVVMDNEMKAAAKDNIYTHGHLNNTPLSPSDLSAFVGANSFETRAVSNDGSTVSVAQRSQDGWGTDKQRHDTQIKIMQASNAYLRTEADKYFAAHPVANGKLEGQPLSDILNRMNEKMAGRFNYSYHVEHRTMGKLDDIDFDKRYKLEGNTVVNADTGKIVPGGKHKNHAEALAHMRALYANVPDAQKAVGVGGGYGGYNLEGGEDETSTSTPDDKPILKVDWAEYFKHCGVCPEDSDYFGAPISKEDIDIPDKGHANKDMEFVVMRPEGKQPLPALWKPEGGEDEKLNERIDGHQCPREEVAWLLDQCLGFHLVPVAYVAELEGERGVAMWYVQSPPKTDPKPADQYAPEWIERMAVLDCILCNLDRPSGDKNRLTHPDDPRRVMAIDNSLSCPPGADEKPKSVFVDMMADKPISEQTLQAVRMCLGDLSMWRDMQDVLSDWDNVTKAKQVIENMRARAQLILDNGMTSYESNNVK